VIALGMAIFHLPYSDLMSIPVGRRYRLGIKMMEIENKKWGMDKKPILDD
jgi:phage-related protein